MSRSRFFLEDELPSGSPVTLPLTPDDEHHALRVLRVRPGEELDVVAPSGVVVRVRVDSISEAGIAAEPLGEASALREPDIALFQGLAKGEKMDDIVRRAVEVGAAAVVPMTTERSVVRLTAEKRGQRGERWRRVAKAAAEQSRRSRLPLVRDPVGFDEALEMLGTYDRVFVAWEEHHGELLSAAARRSLRLSDARVALVVGPEGGLSADEVAALEQAGATITSLGPTIMRTETAAVVGLGLLAAAVHETQATDGS